MITSNNKLEVFESFLIDRTLPKFKKKRTKEEQYRQKKLIERYEQEGDDMAMSSEDFESFEDAVTFVNPTFSNGTSGHLVIQRIKVNNDNWFVRLFKLVFVYPWFPRREEVYQLSVEDFFKELKNSAEELVVVKERAAGYERAIINAKAAGQHALLEQLTAGLRATRVEVQLIAMGLNKYVTEANVVKFYKLSDKGLRLTWIKNFARTIPEDIVFKKAHADEVGLFDNYLVLHYDPDMKSYAETKEERDRRKDPILFGVMNNRRTLYYVGDWVDEYCDLTLDKFAEIMAAEGVNAVKELETPQ